MNPEEKQGALSHNPVIHHALQLTALGILLVWGFRILEPFITPLVWGSVLAIMLYPLHAWLTRIMKNRNALSAVLITALLMLLIIGPAIWLLLATVDELRDLGNAYREGLFTVPPPSEKVKGWPVIGSTVYGYWSEASANMANLVSKHSDQVKSILLKMFDLLKSAGAGIGLFAISIIISGIMLAYAKEAGSFATSMLVKLVGSAGTSLSESTAVTVRNVAKGVLGVAVIQSLLAGVGLVVAGVPLAGLWILVCLVLAVVQIGVTPVSVGSIIYMWSSAETGPAVMFTIWMIFVGLIDNVLKPLLMGKGAPVPMLIVFLGAIGGFIFSGFIGLFTGAIVLTLVYKLAMGWLGQGKTDAAAQSS